MRNKTTDEGWRWKYFVEKKKVKELKSELKTLQYCYDRVNEAHIKTSDAWYHAEMRFDKIYALNVELYKKLKERLK